jgi:hypothetical protein
MIWFPFPHLPCSFHFLLQASADQVLDFGLSIQCLRYSSSIWSIVEKNSFRAFSQRNALSNQNHRIPASGVRRRKKHWHLTPGLVSLKPMMLCCIKLSYLIISGHCNALHTSCFAQSRCLWLGNVEYKTSDLLPQFGITLKDHPSFGARGLCGTASPSPPPT